MDGVGQNQWNGEGQMAIDEGQGQGRNVSFRPGDWSCACGAHNFSSREACFKCRLAKPGLVPRQQQHHGHGSGPVPRPGDWHCACGALNFASRDACFKCRTPAAGVHGGHMHQGGGHMGGMGGGGGGGGMSTSKPGDWNCKCGALNFARRTSCFKCNTPK